MKPLNQRMRPLPTVHFQSPGDRSLSPGRPPLTHGAPVLVGLMGLMALITACGERGVSDDVNSPPPDQSVVVQDEYDYYPTYDMYYNPYRRLYYYRNDGAWVTRPSPPGVSVDVFLGSPHAHMDFHDHPQYHHSEVVRHYPRNWTNRAPDGGHAGERR